MMPGMSPNATTAVLLLVAYLLGSVSGSLVLGRLRGVDIRQHGSGNAGGTNALRTQGKRFALGVALIDVGKGTVAAWLALRFAPLTPLLSVTAHGYMAAAAAVIGHVWPLWHRFRGGKGAATLIGGMLLLWPWVILPVLLVWGGVLLSTGYVGLATVATFAGLPVWAWLGDAGPERMWFAAWAALLIAFTHRANLLRLRSGSESRFERARLLHKLYGRSRH